MWNYYLLDCCIYVLQKHAFSNIHWVVVLFY